MKLAFISDIHANLPALEAVLKDVEKHNPDEIYCLGDLVNFAGWDNETIELIRSKNISCIQGNHDEGIGYHRNNFPFSYNSEAQKNFGIHSIQLTNKAISEENRKYLSNLPFKLQIEFRFPFHTLNIAMVHGSIWSNNEYVKEDTHNDIFVEMLDSINADILLMGHTHLPYHRAVFCEEENRKEYRHVINVGSVGKPKQGNNKACYVLLEFNNSVDLSDPDAIQTHFHFVDYDVEKVIQHIHSIGLNNAYDDFLRQGAKIS